MGSFDCFCALCSGPLGKGWVKFGRKNEKALAKRRRRVGLKKKRLAGEDFNESDRDEDDEMEDDAPHDENEIQLQGSATGAANSAGQESVPDTRHDHDVALSLDVMEEGGDANDETRSHDAGDRLGENHDAEGNEDGWQDESENNNDSDDNNDSEENADEAGSLDSYEEKCSYDPTKLSRKDVRWLDRGRTLGFNPEAPGVTKCFISGLGQYDDYGSFRIEIPGNEPNDPNEDEYTCYTTFQSDEHPTYPFHEACLQVLKKCLGLREEDDIDRDVLYEVFAQNSQDYASALSFDYGHIEGPEQFWSSFPGEEYVACDPGYREGLGEVFQSLIPSKLFKKNVESLELERKVQDDPLGMLPYDVLYEICTYLSFTDEKSFTQSSLHVYTSTQNGAFWKHMMRLHIYPWLWEACDIMKEGVFSEDLDDKSLFLWLEAATRPRFGAGGPLMGIINRRRIWNTCQQLAPQYAEKMLPVQRAEPDEAEARDILDRATCLHMPAVAYPIGKQIRTVSVQFIRSWEETSCGSSVLDTYWGQNGALVGISITLNGDNPRVFGSTQGDRGNPLHIPRGEWIREIVASIDDVNMFSRKQDRSQFQTALDNVPYGTACIRTLTVKLTNNTSKTVRQPTGLPLNNRTFIVLPGLQLIGLTGQVGESGEICRLGLLQAPIPGLPACGTSFAISSYTEAQQLLWNHSARTLYCHREGTYSDITAHPSLKIRALSPQGSAADPLRSFTGDIPNDMTPWHVGIWATNGAQYKSLERISCFQPIGGTASSGNETWSIPDIVGFGWGRASGDLCLLAGAGGPVPVQSPDWQEMKNPRTELVSWIQETPLRAFDEESTEHFLIDGPGGEIVTAVHASSDMKAVRLFTNRDRSCYFGEQNRGQWLEFRAESGHMIVGIVCAFGRLGGWSWGAKMQSHWMLSGLGVLTVAEDYF
ncbi:hypothetical protein PMIN06_009236 [Paraphaeosphaeria minitans]|uniref:F-box domain protein n=1 Tax=Paraphaeosphaeria minitans TaxID=565426 RepID=A0A9P6GQ74_9PLEO|nr:F-box domain protein [Paraphaeosphaeria minitans]